jgi:hypothetical protein
MKGIYKRGNKWWICYSFNGELIRKSIGYDRKLAEETLKAIKGDIVRDEHRLKKNKERLLFNEMVEEYYIEKAEKRSLDRDRAAKERQEATLKKGDKFPSETDFPTGTAKQKIIKDTGKTKPSFHKWAKEANIPKEKVMEYEALCNAEGKEMTSAGLLHHTQPKQKVENPPIPKNTYRIIYADPPWKYTDHTPVMPLID